MQFSKVTTAVVALSLITIGLVGFAAIGAAQEETDLDEIENSTIETTANTSYVELDIEFAEEFTNTDTENVDLTVFDETEYNESGDAAEPVLEAAVAGSPNETVTNEYTVGTATDDPLEPETEYRVIIETENADHIVSGYFEPDDEAVGGVSFGGSADGSPGFGAAVAVAAIAVAGVVTRVRSGGA
ncbi:hypothetical protein [Natronorubrum sp. FCH18a]|uniref:hypothetical protein n=1 Tax=Natronorubrum sp. FCH18a TaxID=3447018 RepID=UPI003F518EEC